MATNDERTTLATVAASAGVSIATVSKVLNGRGDVSAATRERVQDVLRRHDYIGRRSGSVRPPALELFFQGTLTPYSVEVLQGVVTAGDEAGIDVVVDVRPTAQHGSPKERPIAWARGLVAAGRVAVLAVTNELSDGAIDALTRARLPLVVIDPLNTPTAPVTSVGSTNFAGGLAATDHLLSLGHRRIAYLGGPTRAGCNQARLQGFRGAMEAADAGVPAEYVRNGTTFAYDDGVAAVDALLRLRRPPTAIFAGNDELALGAIEAARARGLRIPDDLSVIGFDDTHVARLASPPLTTIRQPLQEMGAVAVRTALRLAAGEGVDSRHVELATELVVRRSTASPD